MRQLISRRSLLTGGLAVILSPIGLSLQKSDAGEVADSLAGKVVDFDSLEPLRKWALEVAKKHGINIQELTLGDLHFYSKYFSEITKQIQGEKLESFVKDFYGVFPNGNDLASYVNSTLHFNWLSPQRKYSRDELQPYVDEITRRFKIREVNPNFKNLEAKVAMDFTEAYAWHPYLENYSDSAMKAVFEPARHVLRFVAEKFRRYEAMQAARIGASHIASGPARKAARNYVLNIFNGAYSEQVHNFVTMMSGNVAHAAGYILVKDLPLTEQIIPGSKSQLSYEDNPFKAITDIYSMGLWVSIHPNRGVALIWNPRDK